MPASHEDRIRNAVNAFEQATARIVGLLEGLNEEAASRTPEGGGWSPAQVGLHVAMTNELFAGVFSGAVPLAKPAPAGFTENPNVFSAIPEKVKTADPLEPSAAAATRAAALQRLRAVQPSLSSAMKQLDATRASGEVLQFPFGAISLYQAAEFVGPHTDRHIAQIHRAVAQA